MRKSAVYNHHSSLFYNLGVIALFYDQLRAVTAMIPASEFLIPCGDWNGHVGSTGSGYKEVHGGYGYGKPDPDSEGERILEYALAYDLFLGNTFQET